MNNITNNGENHETEGANFILKEITKLSSHLSLAKPKGNYMALKTYDCPEGFNNSSMVKSKSAFVIDRQRNSYIPTIDEDDDSVIDYNSTIQRRQNVNRSRNFINNLNNNNLPREPISVPNFTTLTLPTPVLTPVEAARLVFLDPDDEQLSDSEQTKKSDMKENLKYNMKGPANLKGSDSYSSHLNYTESPLYKQYFKNKSNQKQVCELTSDYASNETMSGLLSASNYSIKQLSNGVKSDERNGTSGWKSKKVLF